MSNRYRSEVTDDEIKTVRQSLEVLKVSPLEWGLFCLELMNVPLDDVRRRSVEVCLRLLDDRSVVVHSKLPKSEIVGKKISSMIVDDPMRAETDPFTTADTLMMKWSRLDARVRSCVLDLLVRAAVPSTYFFSAAFLESGATERIVNLMPEEAKRLKIPKRHRISLSSLRKHLESWK